ncbi:MAG: AAA family ATPase [Planctomycetaceae bacterium]|nr:AAA family ATPase [Planctomycetaceae bacterium]
MALSEEIAGETEGAIFRRADLHIHSYGEGGSYDVCDTTMTPEAIVDTAMTENLHVISITDHNQIGNVGAAIKHAEGKNLLVVPGVELSTPQGHLLVYCPSLRALQTFYGKLNISADRKTCHNLIPQCLEEAENQGGFGICAHIELESGFDACVPKSNEFKEAILKCPNLLALEVAQIANETWYTNRDCDGIRKHLANLRRTSLEHEDTYELAKVMSSDAHTLNAMGRNASGNRRLTRLKMESLTFSALRLALIDSAARTRLEDLLPETIPQFVGMKLEGGFLNGQIIRFSRNLTCIIGGRGAGKSTMIESLRVTSGNNVETDLVDSEVWPDSISLLYRDEVGQEYIFTRNKSQSVVNQTDLENGPRRIAIESYGQGETAETIQHCDKDPSILLRFLDDFIRDDLADLYAKDEMIRDQLLENQTLIERLNLAISQIDTVDQAKKTADRQLDALKAKDAKTIVELEEKLAAERTFRAQLTKSLKEVLESVKMSNLGINELLTSIDDTKVVAGKDEFVAVQKIIREFSGEIELTAKDIKTKTDAFITDIKDQLQKWMLKEKEIQDKIENIRRDLEKNNIRLDIAFIRKVTKDSSELGQKLTELKKNIPLRREACRARLALTQERQTVCGRIHALHVAFARQMTENLSETVVDYSVNIRFHEGTLCPKLEEIIQTKMNWRTSQVPRARLIVKTLSPFAVLEAIANKSSVAFQAIKDEQGTTVFTAKEAGEILATLSTQEVKFMIERCEFFDRPEIKITKTVEHSNGTKTYPQKDFSQLSLGQQQSILLSIMLFSKSRVPLIIDQPEDNLDSEFIYKTLVRTLRRVKECRQVIIVTHNANIAVLGDAELILPLRGSADKSVVRNRGSIDNTATKEIVCTILEGSKEAFRKRQVIYGLND